MSEPTPPTPGKTPRLRVYIDELPDQKMQISINRAEGYLNQRELRYVEAILELLLKELPTLCARVENRPLPKVRLVPVDPPNDQSN